METVLLTTLQLAKRLGLAPITLQIWRSQGVGIPFVRQGTRVFYRLADVQDYERRNVQSLSAWLLGSDRPLAEMEALVRAANLPLQKIRQRIANPQEIDDDEKSLPPESVEPSADSDWQPFAPQKLARRLNSAIAVGMSTALPFSPKAPELITTQQAADRFGLTTSALHELRCRDDGLPIVQKGFTLGYRLEDIQAFEQREALAMAPVYPGPGTMSKLIQIRNKSTVSLSLFFTQALFAWSSSFLAVAAIAQVAEIDRLGPPSLILQSIVPAGPPARDRRATQTPE